MIRNKAPYDSYWIDALVLIAVLSLEKLESQNLMIGVG